MKEYKFKINGNDYDVVISAVEDNKATVSVNGSSYDVEVQGLVAAKPAKKPLKPVHVSQPTDSPMSTQAAAPRSSSAAAGAIKSPLPGVIFDVMVREGDTVKEGQNLMILEAMKMENNIEADRAGVVKEIRARKGDSVLEGDVLITIG